MTLAHFWCAAQASIYWGLIGRTAGAPPQPPFTGGLIRHTVGKLYQPPFTGGLIGRILSVLHLTSIYWGFD